MISAAAWPLRCGRHRTGAHLTLCAQGTLGCEAGLTPDFRKAARPHDLPVPYRAVAGARVHASPGLLRKFLEAPHDVATGLRLYAEVRVQDNPVRSVLRADLPVPARLRVLIDHGADPLKLLRPRLVQPHFGVPHLVDSPPLDLTVRLEWDELPLADYALVEGLVHPAQFGESVVRSGPVVVEWQFL